MLHYGCFLVTNLCISYVFNGAILWLVVNKNLMHKLIEGFTSYWCNPVQRNKLYQSLGDADSSCLLDCWYWGCVGKKEIKCLIMDVVVSIVLTHTLLLSDS